MLTDIRFSDITGVIPFIAIRLQIWRRGRMPATANGSEIYMHTFSCKIWAIVSIIVLPLAFCGAALGQSATEENRIYLLTTDGSLKELPAEPGTPKSTRSPGMAVVGVGKSKTFTELGGRAAIRIGSGTPQTFVVGMSMAAPLPASLDSAIFAMLHRFDLNKKTGNREWLFSSTTGGYVYFKNKAMTSTFGIPLNFERYNDHAIKIQPRIPLTPGEYGFLVQPVTHDPYASTQTYFRCFGID
jgi:hypothetical protein